MQIEQLSEIDKNLYLKWFIRMMSIFQLLNNFAINAMMMNIVQKYTKRTSTKHNKST